MNRNAREYIEPIEPWLPPTTEVLSKPSGLRLQLTKLLTVQRCLIAILILAAGFYIPALYGGYMTDDFFHLLALDGLPKGFTERLNLFGLVKSQQEVEVLKQSGIVPWWTSLDLRINFFRPLPSLTHYLDFQIFGRNAFAAHCVSLVWYVFAVWLASRLFMRVAQASSRMWLAVLATAVFAFDDAHAVAIQWLANRNELIATSFVLLAFLGYIRFRESRSFYFLILTSFAYLAALLSKESSIILPFLVGAHAFLFRKEQSTQTNRTLRIFVSALFAISLVYAASYLLAGHGARSVYYLNPLHDPLAWLKGFVLSLASNAAMFMTNAPLHVLGVAPLAVKITVLSIVAPLTIVFWYLAWRWLRHDRWCQFFFLWAFLLQPLITTSFADPRLLFLPSVGFAYIAACLIEKLWSQRFSHKAIAATCYVFVGLHFLFAPILSQVTFHVVNGFQDRYLALTRSMNQVVREVPATEPNVYVFLLNYEPRETSALFQLHLYDSEKLPAFRPHTQTSSYINDLKIQLGSKRVHYYALSHLPEGTRVQVLNERSILLEAFDKNYFPSLFDQLYMTNTTFKAGQKFNNGVFEASIEAVSPEGHVSKVRFDFNEPVRSSQYRFVHIRHDGLAQRVFL